MKSKVPIIHVQDPVQGYSNVPDLPPPSGTAAAYGLVRGINQEDINVTVDFSSRWIHRYLCLPLSLIYPFILPIF